MRLRMTTPSRDTMRWMPTLVATLAMTAVLCVACGAEPAGATSAAGMPTEKVTIAGETFTLDLAATNATREKGLGDRDAIPDRGGMLFVFPDAQIRRFWMLDCTIDIDIAFLDPLGFVTAVHTMKAEPPRRPNESLTAYQARLKLYPSINPAQFAIELQAGSMKRLGVKPGDKIPLDLRRLKSRAR